MPAIETCSLTFDDGPDPVWTPRVLDGLLHECARATFFVMARRARSAPELIDRMQAEGHEVAFHCVRHVRHTDMDGPALRRDTADGLRVLWGLGARARRWRPPWGILSADTAAVAADHDLELVGWTADPEDWGGACAAQMHGRLRDEIRAGAVVLLHDGLGPGARRSDCRETVELIPRLVETMERRGLQPVPLSGNSR